MGLMRWIRGAAALGEELPKIETRRRNLSILYWWTSRGTTGSGGLIKRTGNKVMVSAAVLWFNAVKPKPCTNVQSRDQMASLVSQHHCGRMVVSNDAAEWRESPDVVSADAHGSRLSPNWCVW